MPGGGRLEGRIALLTGASRGLGAAVAVRFAAEGAHPVLLARTPGALEEVDDRIRAEGGRATLLTADLCESGKIEDLAAALFERFGRLDILVAAAAELGPLSPLGHYDPQTWSRVIDLDLTVNWRLIRALDPLLRLSPAGRAIFVTCALGREPAPYWGPYAVAKAGLEALVRIYAGEVAKSSVRANLVDPGAMRTGLRARAFPGEDPGSLPAPESLTEAFVRLALGECRENGALVLAQDPELAPGPGFQVCA